MDVVAVPSAMVPVIVFQKVDVPLVASTCPVDPVALLESWSSPVRRRLAIVEEARYEIPVAEKEPEVVAFTEVRLVMLARVATREEKNPLVELLLVAVRLVIVALVVVELPTIKLVMLARVATREEIKELVEVAFTEERFVAKRLVELLLVEEALVVVKLVVVAEVIRALVP